MLAASLVGSSSVLLQVLVWLWCSCKHVISALRLLQTESVQQVVW